LKQRAESPFFGSGDCPDRPACMERPEASTEAFNFSPATKRSRHPRCGAPVNVQRGAFPCGTHVFSVAATVPISHIPKSVFGAFTEPLLEPRPKSSVAIGAAARMATAVCGWAQPKTPVEASGLAHARWTIGTVAATKEPAHLYLNTRALAGLNACRVWLSAFFS
jgi:hypothetical protein